MLATFSLDTIPQVERAEMLRTAFANYTAPIAANFTRTDQLRATFFGTDLGVSRLEGFDVRGATGTAVRRATTSNSSIEPALTLHLVNAGALHVVHAARTAELRPGCMMFSSADDPLAMTQQDRCAIDTLTIPFDELKIPLHSVRSAVARVMDAQSPVAGTTMRILKQLSNDTAIAPEADWAVLERTTIELIRAIILLADDDRSAQTALGATLSERILDYVAQHLLDPNLDAATIASVHGISVRYLYVILSRQDIGLGDWIRDHRLAYAAAVLRDPRASNIPIAEIAYRSGFADHAHFSRSFRASYGITPSEWRG